MERTELNTRPMVDKTFLYGGNGEAAGHYWKADRTKTVLVKRLQAKPIYFNVELLHDAVWEGM